jgi:hypothetical protein
MLRPKKHHKVLPRFIEMIDVDLVPLKVSAQLDLLFNKPASDCCVRNGFIPGNTNRGGWLSTIDLLTKVSCFAEEVNIKSNIKRS